VYLQNVDQFVVGQLAKKLGLPELTEVGDNYASTLLLQAMAASCLRHLNKRKRRKKNTIR
jgi:hypothetical protein